MYVIETVKPSCGNGGYIWYQCSSCSYQLKKILLATGEHEYDAKEICMNCGKVDGEPMECDHASAYEFKYYGYECSENYTVSYRCPDCNYVFEKIGPAEDSIHHYNGTDNCVQCGAKIECKHNMVESEWLDATCGEHGYIIMKCLDCGFTEKLMTHATGNHIYDENGNCVNCDKFISGSTNCDHFCVINSGWRSSSCDEDGYKEYRCLDCNQILEVTVPNIDGHVYYDGEETCGYCGHQKDDLIENGYVTVN